MKTRFSWLLMVGLVAAAVVVAQALAADKHVGQTGSGGGQCSTGLVVLQKTLSGGASYTVPSGKYKIRSWQTQAGTAGGQMALVVFRSTGVADEFKVVGTSTLQTLTPNVLNTFSTTIKVKGGDVIGLWCSSSADGFFVASGGNNYNIKAQGSVPSGGTVIPFNLDGGERVNISATMRKI